MKNLVTYETALKLKAAGFPIPQPEFGQVWYINGTPYAVIYKTGDTWNLRDNEGFNMACSNVAQSMIFAPTATDILDQLPDDYNLNKVTVGGRIVRSCDNYKRCAHVSAGGHMEYVEAAASVWLSLDYNKKNPE